MVRRREDWRKETLSREGEVLAGCSGEGVGWAVARSGHWGRELDWWAGGRWSNRSVTVIVVNGTPKLLGQEPSPRQNRGFPGGDKKEGDDKCWAKDGREIARAHGCSPLDMPGQEGASL